MTLLEVKDLSISYRTKSGCLRAVRNFGLELVAGESLALVGETGSGKSTVALALMGLLDGNAVVDAGEIRFEGKTLSTNDTGAWSQVRGRKIGLVFQDARGSLNPVMTVGSQLTEAMRAHQRLKKPRAREIAGELLTEVGVPEPPFYLRRYPSELSGGMCQRVAIGLALCNQPQLLIADEPTSALDPSIQAQILDLLSQLRRRHGLSLLLISHDLALVSEVCERVSVMYHGRVVESGRAQEVFRQPAHPYTSSLIRCLPDLDHCWERLPLNSIPGAPPAAGQDFPGCAFAPRCPKANPDCCRAVPPPITVSAGHWAACIMLAPSQ